MILLFYITAGFLLIYGILIEYYKFAWKSIHHFNIKRYRNWHGKIKVTVIIPARNEENNIIHCLESLAKQTYPDTLLEIIVVNDHSTDRTEEKVKTFPGANIRLINLEDHLDTANLNSYKKKAIEIAIGTARGELIVTTDADCVAGPDWIKSIAAFHDRYHPVFIAAPVKIQGDHSLLSIFQVIDFITLQGITGSSVHKKIHSMCNGANLAYDKETFYKVGGFEGIDHIASGDDMLLMHKIFLKFPDRVFFLKCDAAIVSTQPAYSWKSFFEQRIRWASKADKYDDRRIFGVLLLVYVLNFLLLIFLIASAWNSTWLLCFLILVLSKTIIEYSFVQKIASFFRQQNLMVYFPFLQPLHIIYTVVAGFLGKFGRYEWKGRKVK